MDPYEILGIAPGATRREAEAAYRRLATLFHPDRLQGLRADVRAEGERRLREVTAAIRLVREQRPLQAAGHAHAARHREPEPPAAPVLAPSSTLRSTPGPSDAATAAEARVYEVYLCCLEGPTLRARWYGPHAAATLAALRHGHRIDGAIRQIEWGAYEVVLDGAATRRLLRSALGDAELCDPVEILAGGGERSADLDAIVDLLVDDGRYELTADVY